MGFRLLDVSSLRPAKLRRDVELDLKANYGYRPVRPVAELYGLLIFMNIGAWVWALMMFSNAPLLLSTCVLAYGLGLRHGVDADHIAAIDNVTRKLMGQGQRPVGAGLFFALGHSSVVVVAALVIAAAADFVSQIDRFKGVSGIFATGVSAVFLFIIAALNLVILRSVYDAFRRVKNGEPYVEGDLNILLSGRGLLVRVFRPLFRLVNRSWHMVLLGFLFGLGFDTATEVSLLGISASQGAHGFALASIMVFPGLFAAGMALVDTTDGVLMVSAYSWAFVKPLRKLYYNLTVTLVSALVAIVIGGAEVLGLIADRFGLEGPFWSLAKNATAQLGFLVIAVFALAWLASVVFYHLAGYEHLPQVDVIVDESSNA
jgi:nickel/cobalt transporter (NiCoT) family protein